MEKQFIPPKIYSAKGDLKKRWYVYYSFRNPQTGKMERQPPLTMSINRRFKTVKGRMEQLKILQKATLQALKDGFNPYLVIRKTESYNPTESVINSVLQSKSKVLKASSIRDYTIRTKRFLKYLDEKGILTYDIKKINRSILMDYLDNCLMNTSARSRNNEMTVLSSIFSEILNKELIEINPLSGIKKLKTHSKRDATINTDDLERIEKHLEKNNPPLLTFIKCVGFLFLRPIEVIRLKIEDVNVNDRIITVEIKQKDYKTKIIPDIILNEIIQMIGNRKSGLLFNYSSPFASEDSRRNYFSKEFIKVRKALKLPDNYTIYSFRHTYITKVYKELRKEFNQEESLSKLRLITGHTSDAIHKYIHYIDAELPADYSDLLK